MRLLLITISLMSSAVLATASDRPTVPCSDCPAIAAQDYADCINGVIPVCKFISCTPQYCTTHSNAVLNRCLANCTAGTAARASIPERQTDAATKAGRTFSMRIPASLVRATQ